LDGGICLNKLNISYLKYMILHPITDPNQLDPAGTYTLTDYHSWQFDELVELIKGKLVRMSPAPKLTTHGRIVRRVVGLLQNQLLEGNPCEYFFAPVDVYLNPKEAIKPTIVQPDIFIGCNEELKKAEGYLGAPDWVCEIVSRGSLSYDTGKKKKAYEESGVKEYALIYPEEGVIQVFVLGKDGFYQEPITYSSDDAIYELATIPGVELKCRSIFLEIK
jgi:Uma2 family endonuclease